MTDFGVELHFFSFLAFAIARSGNSLVLLARQPRLLLRQLIALPTAPVPGARTGARSDPEGTLVPAGTRVTKTSHRFRRAAVANSLQRDSKWPRPLALRRAPTFSSYCGPELVLTADSGPLTM